MTSYDSRPKIHPLAIHCRWDQESPRQNGIQQVLSSIQQFLDGIQQPSDAAMSHMGSIETVYIHKVLEEV